VTDWSLVNLHILRLTGKPRKMFIQYSAKFIVALFGL